MAASGTRVDFYLLAHSGLEPRFRFACRLTEKAWHLSHRIHAVVSDDQQARQLDELLWTFRAGSFVPHEITSGTVNPAVPVSIGIADTEPPPVDLLINLTDQVPDRHAEYPRIAEIVDADDQVVKAGRTRYRYYRDQGYDLEMHRMQS